MRFCRIWRGLISPRDGIDIEAVARIARPLGRKIHGELERSQLRVLADLSRRDLICSRRQAHLDAGLCAVVGMHARQPCCRSARMIPGSVAEGVRLKMRKTAD